MIFLAFLNKKDCYITGLTVKSNVLEMIAEICFQNLFWFLLVLHHQRTWLRVPEPPEIQLAAYQSIQSARWITNVCFIGFFIPIVPFLLFQEICHSLSDSNEAFFLTRLVCKEKVRAVYRYSSKQLHVPLATTANVDKKCKVQKDRSQLPMTWTQEKMRPQVYQPVHMVENKPRGADY